MKAVQLWRVGEPLAQAEVLVPSPGPRDLLVRVKAAGICHSDAHYRAGTSFAGPLPLTLGHEVAGIVEVAGREVLRFKAGDRVCVHYLATCGECSYCAQGNEQFCFRGAMIGKHRDGGFAEFILIPARSAFFLPDEIPFESGAVMMCSSATALHALNKARLRAGERVAVFGLGGLGFSAIQLAGACGAGEVFAVDIQPPKLEKAAQLGAIAVDARSGDAAQRILELTSGKGVDVALELIGLPATMRQTVQCLGIKGRAVLAGITDRSFEVAPYAELLNKEAEIIGVSDHLAQELPFLIELARTARLDLSPLITRTVPLEAQAINDVLDDLVRFGPEIRSVVVP
jgi:propanol-preferring alcohol dehydrogenase